MAFIEQVQKLKESWLKDPAWDIETTEGFENHVEELKKFRLECEARWDKEENNKTYQDRIKDLRKKIKSSENNLSETADDDYLSQRESLNIQLMQVQATLLLAEQVRNVVDLVQPLAHPIMILNKTPDL